MLPESYTLDLDVDLEAGTFSGTVKITVNPVKEVNFLTFNVDLAVITIANISLDTKSGSNPLKKFDIEQDEARQMVTIKWGTEAIGRNSELLPGTPYLLSIEYTANLRPDMYGFYKSSYKNAAQKDV